MRAVQLRGYGSVEMLQYREDVPVPDPGPADVLVKVGACGMNNTDINLRTRWYDREVETALTEEVGMSGASAAGSDDDERSASWNSDQVTFPRIQGAAVAGRIVAIGSEIGAERIGERVLVDPQVRDKSRPLRAQLVAYLGGDRDGGFAEYVCVPSENAIALECRLSDAELATFPTSYDTAEEMLERARLSAGETVVVTGAAGGVGTALIQLSLIRGARVVAIASAAKEESIRDLGAHHFVAREHSDVRKRIEALIGEQGAHVVADIVGGPIFGDLLKLLCRGGRYATAGALAGPIQPFDLRDLIYKDLEMYGITCPTPKTFRRIVDYAASGKLKALVDEVYPLERLSEAQTAFVKRTHFGKFVVVP
jgi:NADPH:quinone reductase-like Zn-dependent oxidoreductase